MKKLVATIIGLALCVNVTHSAITLGELIDTDGSISSGPMTFSNFGFATAAPITAYQVTVDALTFDGWQVIRFGGPLGAINGAVNDYEITYGIHSRVPFDKIDQTFNLGALGTGGTIVIGETVYGDAGHTVFLAQSSVGFSLSIADMIDPPGELAQGDLLEFNPVTEAFVDKDIFIAANQGGVVTASTIYQSFHVVPEPHEYALLAGLGLIVFGTIRRWKSAK